MTVGFVRTIGELFSFLVQRRAWFLIPIVVGLLAIGALIVLPFMALLLVIGIFSSVALGGFLLSPKALEPKFERLNPLPGIKRLFAAQTLIELIKTLAKAGLVGFIGVKVIWAYRDDMLALSRMAPTEALARGLDLTALCCLLIASSLIIIVLIPLALRGVRYRPASASDLLRRNLLLYGVGGLIAPFVGIKLLDLVISLIPGLR